MLERLAPLAEAPDAAIEDGASLFILARMGKPAIERSILTSTANRASVSFVKVRYQVPLPSDSADFGRVELLVNAASTSEGSVSVGMWDTTTMVAMGGSFGREGDEAVDFDD